MRGHFGDLITAMVTPFDTEGALNLGAAQKLTEYLIENGTEGVVAAGSTGEGAVLSDEEKIALFRAVAEAAGGRASVLAGTGTYDTAHSVHLSKEAAKAGVDGLLVVTPYYNRPPQRGLVAHFKAVASATDLPMLLYDIPIRTGREIELGTLVELSSVENIVGVKDACADMQKATRLVAQVPDSFHIYSGNDGDTLPLLSIGAVGVIAVASHLVGPQMAEMISRFKSGDVEAARKINQDLIPVFDAMGSVAPNPIPLKAALRLLGQDVGEPRLPMGGATEEEIEKLRGVLARAGIL